MEIKNQKSGDNSQNIQGETVSVNSTVNILALIQPVKEMSPQLLESTFCELSKESKNEAKNNQEDFLNNFQKKLESFVTDVHELQKSIQKPDFQYMAKKSLIEAGRMDSVEKRQLLASLLGDRLNAQTDFGEIVYNESLLTIPKLTNKQIKLLALQCEIGLLTNSKISTWEEYNERIKDILSSLLPIDFVMADLQHIAYSGCGDIAPFEKGIVEAISEKYDNLFLKPIKPEEPEFQEIKKVNLLGFFIEKEDGLYFRTNKKNFEKLVKTLEDVDTVLVEKIKNFYTSRMPTKEESIQIIKSNCFRGSELIEVWETKQLKHLTLTSVGIIIGVSVVEQISQKPVGKDEWLGLLKKTE
jgi:preprotein translocase subunit Sss1